MKSLSLEFVSERELYQSFMPFVNKGGLFVKTHVPFELETDIQLTVLLPDSLESSTVTGKVCWLTPENAQSGTPQGIGIAFVNDPDNVKNQIEKTIARLLNSSDATLTM